MLHLGAKMDAAAEPILATTSRMSADWMRDGIVFDYDFRKSYRVAMMPVLEYGTRYNALRRDSCAVRFKAVAVVAVAA